MPYDPTDGTTLTELIRLVRLRIGDFPRTQRHPFTFAGTETVYRLRETVYSDLTVTCTVDGSPNTDFTVDADSSIVEFDTAPTGDGVFSYETVTWSDERITEAINAGIDEIGNLFYVDGENDDLYTDGQGELLIETSAGDDLGPEDRIRSVEWWTGWRWTRLDSWHVRSTPFAKYVVFENTPVTGTRLRVSYSVRPANLDLADDTLETVAGLPGRAKEPIILYAVADLQTDRLHHRIKDDRGHNSQDEAGVKSYEILNDAKFLRSLAEIRAQKLSKYGLHPRVRY